ncbi:MAG TPA: hypothetical protein PK357_02975 [Candidatus Pacearchaeota archaeon]|nr:hypothetical protein [Candidatus Pacearchaeota archaeon]
MKINSNILMGIFFIIILSGIFVILMPFVSSNDTLKINTFLVYEDSASATSKTVSQGDYFNVVMVAYGHGEALQSERLELAGSTLIFQESVSGDKIETYTWLYTKTYTLNTGILTPGTYTLRFTAKTATTQSVEYSDLQLTILPKEIPDTTKPVVDITYPTATTYTSQRTNLIFNVNDDNLKSCSYSLNGASPVNVESLVNGVNTITGISSVTGSNTWTVTCKDYSGNTGTDSVTFKVILPDTTKPVVDITYPTATTYTSQRTNLIFNVNDDNLKSCSYSLNGASPVNVESLVNGVNTVTGISSVTGSNTWTVTCKDYSGNTGTDSVTFNVNIEEPKGCMLQLTKSTNSTNVKVGDSVVFTLKYKNIGDGTCTGGGVKVQDVLNSNFKIIAYSEDVKGDSDGQGISFGYSGIPAYDSSTNTLTFNAHTVSPGEEGTTMISVKVLEPPQCGDFQISNYFKIWSNEKGWQNSNTIKLSVDNDCYTPVCGNNLLETGEECDSGTNNGKPCNPLYGSSCNYCSNSCKTITLTGPYCGDGKCNGNETCSTCPTDCGVCPTNCTICKDSKPLDDSEYDYLAYLNKKTTPIIEETETKNVEKEKSLLKDNPILISLILILGILMLLIVIAIARVIKRKN